jgi:hypothetical protein
MFFGSKLVEAQHGPGHVACDVEWLEAGKPAAEYEKFMQDCLAPYKGVEEEQAPYKGGGEEQWVRPDARLSVIVHNITRFATKVMLYSQNRPGKEWGPYEFDGELAVPSATPMMTVIDCKEGEKICMGAVDSGFNKTTWGIGAGNGACNSCCFYCDGCSHSWFMYFDQQNGKPYDVSGR